MSSFPHIAVDVGNNRLKFGWFDGVAGEGLPEPRRTLVLPGETADFRKLDQWLSGAPAASWGIGSVNRPAASRLIDWLRDRAPFPAITLLAAGDLPLTVALERPDMVGIDRLLDAVAVNRVRVPGRPAVVIDIGSAITVDLVAADGAFWGGAIAPGIALAARALHEFTDLLPLVEMTDLAEPPPALGTGTVPAMRSGLFWGAVGTIRQLVTELARVSGGAPEVYLSGGAGPAVAGLLGAEARHVPHLTLAGIALTAAASQR